MGIDYGKKPKESAINLTKGKVSLAKGQSVTIKKTKLIKATCSWDSKTDYDLYGYLVMRDGTVHAIATFGARGELANSSFEKGDTVIHHLGDVGRAKGTATETIEITLGEDGLAFVPVAYSAQSNGSGSFRRYKVTTEIDNGEGDVVTVPADQASNNDHIYTLVPGVIYNRPEGIEILRLELYSRGGENRPRVRLSTGQDNDIEIVMDAGPRNNYK